MQKDFYNSAFQKLRNDEDFIDLTLVSEDGDEFKVHQAFLATVCDTFKSRMIKLSPHCPRPTIILKDISTNALRIFLDFVYKNEVILNTGDLPAFRVTAKWFGLDKATGWEKLFEGGDVQVGLTIDKDGSVDEQDKKGGQIREKDDKSKKRKLSEDPAVDASSGMMKKGTTNTGSKESDGQKSQLAQNDPNQKKNKRSKASKKKTVAVETEEIVCPKCFEDFKTDAEKEGHKSCSSLSAGSGGDRGGR